MAEAYPCDNFLELALRIHNDQYYCHPNYIELHKKADDIISIYLEYKKSKNQLLVTTLQKQISKWIILYDSIKSKNKTEKVKVNDICAICVEKIEPGEIVRKCSKSKTAHVFHEKCIMDLIIHEKEQKYDNKIKCPTCRNTFDYQYTKEFKCCN